jgi:hypothetical protein
MGQQEGGQEIDLEGLLVPVHGHRSLAEQAAGVVREDVDPIDRRADVRCQSSHVIQSGVVREEVLRADLVCHRRCLVRRPAHQQQPCRGLCSSHLPCRLRSDPVGTSRDHDRPLAHRSSRLSHAL